MHPGGQRLDLVPSWGVFQLPGTFSMPWPTFLWLEGLLMLLVSAEGPPPRGSSPPDTCPGWSQVHPGLPRLLCPLTVGKTERDLELDCVGSRPGSAAFICDHKHVT